jgi:hypothetical protein
MRRRSGIALVGLLSALVLVAGCGGNGSKADHGAAKIVPATAPIYIALNTDESSDQWQALKALAAKFPGKQKAVDSVEGSLRSDSGLDFAKDIAPALGPEIDFVWLDLKGNGDHVVGLMQPKSVSAFEKLVAKGNKKDPAGKLLYEKVGDWEIMADTRTMIDRFKTQSKAATAFLAGDRSFSGAMKAVSSDDLLRVYVNGQETENAIRQQGGQDIAKVVNKAGKLDWIVAGVGASPDGIRFDAVVRGTPGKLLKGNGGQVLFHPKLPGSVPADTIVYFSFHGSKNMFSGLDKGIPQLAQKNMAPVRKLVRELGALLEGENAIYVRQPPPGSKVPEITLLAAPGPNVDGATKLDAILNDPKLNLNRRPYGRMIGDTSARELDFDSFKLDYAEVAHKLVLTDTPAGIQALANPKATLAQAPTYTDAAKDSGLPDKTQGFLYVNVRGGLALGQKLAGAPIPKSVKRNLGPLRSAIEYGVSRPSEIQITFFLRIQ